MIFAGAPPFASSTTMILTGGYLVSRGWVVASVTCFCLDGVARDAEEALAFLDPWGISWARGPGAQAHAGANFLSPFMTDFLGPNSLINFEFDIQNAL